MSQVVKPLKDLTRWNRTGLSRFDYVDGDAAVWLEELRIAMLGLYLRDGDPETRLPEFWRDIYLRPVDQWPDVAQAAARVVWKRLAPTVPPQRETRGRRNERLLDQYDARTDDYAWEINRAFARASHILLGYLNAYTNEGYLRTASQWDNLRRLAAMVNYQPTPPASATNTVGLILNEEAGAVEIPAGLAMKYTPPEGGAPLIFESLATVHAHPALNAARAENWNKNSTGIGFSGRFSDWHLDGDKTLATGDVAVLVEGNNAEAVTLSGINHDTGANTVQLQFLDAPGSTFHHYQSRLWVGPNDLRMGLRVSKNSQVVVDAVGIGAVAVGDLVEVFIGTKPHVVKVLATQGTELVLNMKLPEDGTALSVRPMQSFALDAQGRIKKVATDTHSMWAALPWRITSTTGTDVTSEIENFKLFQLSGAENGRAFAADNGTPATPATVKRKNPQVLPDRKVVHKRGGDAGHKLPRERKGRGDGKVVSFVGKPPKGLANGDWFVARDLASQEIKPLRVTGLRVASGEFHVEFHTAPKGVHNRTEFIGPMKDALCALKYDRNPEAALEGNKVTLENIPEAARVLIKPGHRVLIRRQADGVDTGVLARVDDATPVSGDRLDLTLLDYEPASNWSRGQVTFALNTVQISHGESKGSKLLGSGDGERAAQMFDPGIKNISHIPSTAAEAGVVPDMDIAVDGVRWDYRDYIDPTAQGTRAWSTTLTDTGTLRIHFRRRLVTGQNNVVVTRYRIGAGAAGSGIPPLSFEKPMKKHRHVTGVFQPFATAGGADREPVSKLRQSTPQRLSANGRAVSLSDFEILSESHSAILRAHAEIVPTAGSQRLVLLTVALAGGGKVDGMADDLTPAITARALPGIGVSFVDYEHLPLHMMVKVRSDLSVHNRVDIKAAAEARLFEVFALESREFGQTAYVSEILAALETEKGIKNVTVTGFGLGQAYNLLAPKPSSSALPWPRNVAVNDGRIAAIFATDRQIAHIAADSASAVAVEVEDMR